MTFGHAACQTQFWISSGPGAFIGGQLSIVALIRFIVSSSDRGGRYVFSPVDVRLPSCGEVMSDFRQLDVATHVLWKSASAFSSLVVSCVPSSFKRTFTSADGFEPLLRLWASNNLSAV